MLPKAIESVLTQTFEDWELIIVDDGSTDHTKDLVASYIKKDERIKYIYQENAERSAARNNGIKNASGDYICFLDSDDYYLPNRLQNIATFIDNVEESCLFYYTGIIYEENSSLKKIPEFKYNGGSVYDFLAQHTIGTPQVCISKNLLDKERFDERFSIGEDFELWLRLAKHTIPILIPNEKTVVATEHHDRSVNFKYKNPGKENLEMYAFIFNHDHPGKKIEGSTRRILISNAYFTQFKYWFYQKNRINSIWFLLRSIVACVRHEQTKYKVNLILKLILLRSFTGLNKLI